MGEATTTCSSSSSNSPHRRCEHSSLPEGGTTTGKTRPPLARPHPSLRQRVYRVWWVCLALLVPSVTQRLALPFAVRLMTKPSPRWTLVWSDEFNQTTSTSTTTSPQEMVFAPTLPDPTKWGYEEGFVRNQELQYYQTVGNAHVEQHWARAHT